MTFIKIFVRIRYVLKGEFYMNIIVYTIENKKIVKYTLSFNEIEMLEFINNLSNEKLEENHIYSKNDEPSNYKPTTIITSTENLINYFKSIINNGFLNLEQLNYLFKEYNNPMYSPATMKSINHFLNLFKFEEKEQMSLEEYFRFYQIQATSEKSDINNSQANVKYAFQNKMAFERLGINLKTKYKKEYQKIIKKFNKINN